MEAVKTVLVGAGGYGAHYVKLFSEYIDPRRMELIGVVDPTMIAPDSGWLCEKRVPFFKRIDECPAELTIIASPIPYHFEQTTAAIAGGSHVLCEKPLVPRVSEAMTLMATADAADVTLGVGFQWSFCTPMLTLKRDILAGDFGAPVLLKTLVSWKRYDEYYQTSSWKGRVTDPQGHLVNDSVATNATAHYLHNLFFILGGAIAHSAMPKTVKVEVYRAKEIKTYDTCFMKGQLAGGEFLYIATHAGDTNINPICEYIFENGTVYLNENHLWAKMRDGSVREYGDPQSDASCAEKIVAMLDNIQYNVPIPCGVKAVLPHLTVCRAVSTQCSVGAFADIFREENGSFVRGLTNDALNCYQNGALPGEMGLPWAASAQTLKL